MANRSFLVAGISGITAAVAFALAPSASAANADSVWSVPPQAPSQEDLHPKSSTSGPSLGVGVGYQTPIFGVQAAYDVRLADSGFALIPWAGLGGWDDLAIFGKSSGWHTAYAGGVMATYGEHHRAVIDLAVAPIRFETSTGTVCSFGQCRDESSSHVTYGLTGAIGYEYVSSGGFYVRPMIGANVASPTVQLSLGAKIW